MEVSNSFLVKKIKDKVFVTQTITKEMTCKESIQELAKLRTEAVQLMQQKEQIRKAIEEQVPQKDLAKSIESIEILRKLEKEWQELNKDEEEKLYQELRGKVKVAKAEKGWDRTTNEDARVVLANQILGPLVNEMSLDMAHPVVVRVRKEFGKI